jgi:hypothetical protein
MIPCWQVISFCKQEKIPHLQEGLKGGNDNQGYSCKTLETEMVGVLTNHLLLNY